MLELNTITLGDSYKLIKEIPDNSVDLIVIDPPYLYDSKGSAGCFGHEKKKQKAELKSISSGFDYSILDELNRVMKKTNIYIWCSKSQLISLLNYYDIRQNNIDLITWHKTNPMPTVNNVYLSDTEYCIFARETGVKLYGNCDTKRKYYITGMNIKDKQKFSHPTIKPLKIIKNFIINSSNENDVVLDCFSGSGTTCVACKELNRQFIGIEINEEYYKISINRLNGIQVNGQTSLFVT